MRKRDRKVTAEAPRTSISPLRVPTMTFSTRSTPWPLRLDDRTRPGRAIAFAQDQTFTGKPIDLVFLVDVSRSMFEDPGNDPERIRWDAVLLSMDLLTSEDKVLIIPFNEDSPPNTCGTTTSNEGNPRSPGNCGRS